MRQITLARWHAHVNATQASANLRNWLTLQTSLTVDLRAHCTQFTLQRLQQRVGTGLPDEKHALGLLRQTHVQEREVLLCCDGVPVVFAHTVVPLTDTRTDWPTFHKLGTQSLGTLLFDDPLVWRGPLHYSRLPLLHPLMRRICSAIPTERIESRLHARRCLFRRKQGRMLVTEVFLPRIVHLTKVT